ncbi:MAG: ABC transporter substrate-binding protein, partial [Thermoanaerobaculia bacterium]
RPQSAGDLARSLARYRSKLGDSQQMRSIMVTRTMQAPRSVRSPFVGREKEFQELQQHLNQAVLGECQFAVISGEPGVGKSRLVDELETLAAARQIRVLHGRFVEQRGSFPYHGFCEVIQEYFRQKESGSSASGLPDFSDLAGDLVSLFPMLSEIEVIRSSAGGSSQFNRTGEERLPENRTQIFELLARTLTLLAVGKPLILVLEDLHGAEASIEALEYIVRRLGPTPTLIVGTYRSTEVDRAHPLNRMLEGFEGDRRFSTIKLEAMAPAEHREFLTTLTGGTEIVDALATRLFEVTEGNPFFTKELVRSLLDAGSIAQDKTGTWALAGGMDISSDALPATIQQAVEKRIERLPDELRSILSIASVMGKTFDLDDLEALAGGETDLDDAAERFIHEGLLEEERQSRGDQLSFTSAVVREVLYSQLSRRKRRSLHRKYATQLEKRHTGRLERIYPQLVYHFAEGDVPEKTVEYGLQHARKALGTFSHDDAVRSARTALEFLEEEWEGDPSLEGEARLLLAEGLLMAGNTSGALKEIEVATKVFEELGKNERAARSLLMAAKTAWQARQVEETRRWVERGLEVSRQADDSEILRQFLSLAATLANLRGEYDKGAAYLQEAEKLESGPEQRVAAEEIPEGGRLVVGIANPVSATTPVEMQFIEEFEVFSNVVETLLTTDAQGNLIPNLCEKWETQENGASFLFTLRPDVRFQDGDPLTAEDVKKAFESSIPQSVHELAPGLAAIRGARELAGGKTDRLEGLEVLSDTTFTINLEEPLPIYPALLTDIRTGITRAAGAGNGGPFLGTGPFRLVSQSEERLILERNAQYWKGAPPRLESLEFRPGLSAAELAAGLRSGEVDLARDLLPKDLEELLRDARFRKGLVEAAQKFTYFVLFNVNSGPAAGSVEFRRALSGVVRSHDLVWQTLGRFALPAAGFLPPGILGHDPGRRARLLSQDEARQLVGEAGHEGGLELQAAVHPLMQDRYLPLLEALFAAWEPLGVTVAVATPDMKSFIEAEHANEGIDLCITRWGPDYDDPDNFTHGLFHTSAGLFSAYFSSSEADKLMETGRAEIRPEVRESVYRQFESKLLESATLIPLFYDVDARVASPKVRGIRLGSTPPHVNYSEVGKVETAVASEVPATVSGTLRVPMTARLQSLDPSLAGSDEQAEVLPNIFETLTRDNGKGQIEPWLAREIEVEEEGRRYRFHLRSDVRFHDGRRLTARDVRYSLERLLS